MSIANERFRQVIRIGAVVLSLLLQFLFMTAGLPQQAQAAPGDLDPSFGSGGKVTTNFVPDQISMASSVAVQPDGKIVAAGFTAVSADYGDFALARYNTDGSLDTSFGTGGKVTTDFASDNDGAYSIAIQPDGKIVAAGFAVINGKSNFALARYNTDGSLDTTFGTDGKVTTQFDSTSVCPLDTAYSVAVSADGTIWVGGQTNVDCSIEMTEFGILLRYTANGDFSGYGLPFSGANAGRGGREAIYSVAAQKKDNKIVVAGATSSSQFDNEFALARYNADGSLDTTFGTDGKVFTNFAVNDNDWAYSIAIQADGKIVAGGFTSETPGSAFALARYNTDGSLDTSFGTGGKVTTEFGPFYDEIHSIAIQADGKIVAAGSGLVVLGTTTDFALARYLNFKEICSYLGDNPNPWIPDIDVFKFSGIKDETVTIRIEANPPEAGTGKRVTLILTDKIKGTVLLKLDRSELPNEIAAKLPGTGEYLIAVVEQVLTTKDKRYKGNYCLTLKAQPETSQTLAPALWVE